MAVEGYIGWHGQGKTYCAIDAALTQLDKGVTLVTNVIVHGHRDVGEWLESGELAPPRVLHFETWDGLMLVLEAAIERRLRLQLLIDEAGKFLSSRFYTKLDPRVLTVLQERRKIGAGLDLVWTAPHFDHVDKLLRDVTQVVHVSKRWGGSEYSHDGGKPPRGFSVRSWRPHELGRPKCKPFRRNLVPFVPEVASLYTTGIVSMATPIAAAVDKRPTLREASPVEQPAPPPAVVLVPTGRRGGRRSG